MLVRRLELVVEKSRMCCTGATHFPFLKPGDWKLQGGADGRDCSYHTTDHTRVHMEPCSEPAAVRTPQVDVFLGVIAT